MTTEAKPRDKDWREREKLRLYGGYREDATTGRLVYVGSTYSQVVWWQKAWWRESRDTRDHFTHKSAKNPALIAFTPDDDKGERDIQVMISPGKYLRRFFGNVLTDAQIKFWATWQSTSERPESILKSSGLQFAWKPSEIEDIYISGPRSCMSHHARGYDSHIHPVRVYGAGDLAIAYIRSDDDDEKVLARALVWPEKKVYGRVYPTPDSWRADGFTSFEESRDIQRRLEDLLISEGYMSDSESGHKRFDGARLLGVVDDDDYVVVPYLDHSYGFDDHGDYLVMRQRGYGSYEAQETEGRVCIEDRRPQCDHCGDRVDEDDARPVVVEFRSNGRPRSLETWCRRCVDYHAFNCEGIDEYVSDDLESVDVGDRVYSRPYAEANNCHQSDLSGEWFEGDPVTMDNGAVWSAEEFSEHGFICRIDGGNYPNTEMHSDFDSVWEGHDDETLEREGFITIHDDRQETLPVAA